MRKPARTYLVGALTSVVVIAVIVACALVGTAIGAAAAPRKSTVTGALALTASSYVGVLQLGNNTCSGYGGFADISPGTNVTLFAASGELLAATHLTAGSWTGSRYGSGTCTFRFTFPDIELPGDEPGDLFMVRLGNERRGSVPYTREQLLTTGASMSVGS